MPWTGSRTAVFWGAWSPLKVSVLDSMLTALNMTEIGWVLYSSTWDVDEMILNDPS